MQSVVCKICNATVSGVADSNEELLAGHVAAQHTPPKRNSRREVVRIQPKGK